MISSSVPANVRSWLFDATSLTARLVRLCDHRQQGRFSVRDVRQGYARPFADEHAVLGIRHGRRALIRQVRLYCNDTALVYARTVIPTSTLTGRQRQYANLGNRPLGAMLFADRSMRREAVMVNCLHPGDVLYEMTGAQGEPVWGRRSVFYVGNKPLLVSEYYLPELFRLAA